MRIFYDVDTQNDFMNKDGALYVPDAELIKPALAKITEFARTNRIPIIGSADKHFGTAEYKPREGELKKWGGPFPDHCMANTCGQKKIHETDVSYMRCWPVHLEHKLDGKIDGESIVQAIRLIDDVTNHNVHQSDEITIEKQSYDVFTNPTAEVFLARANIKEAVVYGVATDYCVKAAVLGMQQRGVQCYVVEDAIKGVFPESTKSALEEMTKAGAKFTKTADVLERRI